MSDVDELKKARLRREYYSLGMINTHRQPQEVIDHIAHRRREIANEYMRLLVEESALPVCL
jgi:hypothetical protein